MTLPNNQTVRAVEGYSKVVVCTDPNVVVVNADGSLTYQTFDVGDYASRAIRTTQQNAELFRGPDGTPVNTPGERYDGQVVQDQMVRVLNNRQEEWLRRICMTIISCFKSPELTAMDLMAMIFSADGSGNDPLDEAVAGDHQFVEAA